MPSAAASPPRRRRSWRLRRIRRESARKRGCARLGERLSASLGLLAGVSQEKARVNSSTASVEVFRKAIPHAPPRSASPARSCTGGARVLAQPRRSPGRTPATRHPGRRTRARVAAAPPLLSSLSRGAPRSAAAARSRPAALLPSLLHPLHDVDELLLGVDVHLLVDVVGVGLHRALGYEQLVGDVLRVTAAGQIGEDFALTRGEVVALGGPQAAAAVGVLHHGLLGRQIVLGGGSLPCRRRPGRR